MSSNIICHICSKKLSTIDCLIYKCRCNNYFCQKHLFYADHNCNFDYHNDFKIKNSSNIINLTNKIIKI